jgi:hypothetical protein
MYHNRGGEAFENVTYSGGFGHLQKGHAVAFADFDRDGDLDVFQEMGGAYPGDAFGNALFQNPGFGHHWLAVELVGTTSARSAIGAKIEVGWQEGDRQRTVHRSVNSGGSFGSNPLRQHIGVGERTQPVSLQITWPATGATQRFDRIPVDQVIRLREGEEHVERLPLGES